MEKNKKIKKNETDLFSSVWVSVKAVVINNDKVLVLRRSKKEKFNKKAYDLPGGHIDKGESIKECLEREIRDETGLDAKVGDILSVEEYPKDHEMFDKAKALRFIAYADSDDIELSEEHDKFEWMTFEGAIKKIGSEGYEGEKRDTIIKAQEYLEMQKGVDSWKRCLADFENYKKMQAESNRDTIKYATENIVSQILPVLDNFTSSIDHIPQDQKDGPWVQGIMYIKKQLEDVFRENGIEEIEIKIGDDFDTKTCEAIEDKACKSCGKKEKFKNKIKKVVLKGYKIGEKIIRPVKVIVE